MSRKNKKILQNTTCPVREKSTFFDTKYFFIIICSIEILFISYQSLFASTRNGGTFLATFLIVLAISFLPGLGVALHVFRNKPWPFLFSFGLCVGFGFVGGVWALMIVARCPLLPHLYIGTIIIIAACLLYRKRRELRGRVRRESLSSDLAGFLSPLAVLLFGFIVLSSQLINHHVPMDVDSQSDSFNSLMILKEGTYPFVFPYRDQTRLMLCSGPLFHTMVAVITKLKGAVLVKEVMAMTVICGAFFCMAVYFLAKCIIKHEIILFLAGILTLTRAYIACFNDNLPENMAFYYGAMFMVLLMYCLENKKVVFALFAGFYLCFCALSHPEIFLFYFPTYGLFCITFLLANDKDVKKDYGNFLIITGIVAVMIFPYYLRIKGNMFSLAKIEANKMHETLAATLTGTFTYWNGYLVPLLALGGIAVIAAKRKTVHIYLWTSFLSVLVFIEFWRFFQIFSLSWFELKPLGYFFEETEYVYKTFLVYPNHYHAAWYAGVIIWPVAIAAFIAFLDRLCRQYSVPFLHKYAIVFLTAASFLFLGNEYKSAKRYPVFLEPGDYAALTWIKDNTLYGDTLLYAPFDDTDKKTSEIYQTSFWVPIVSERKSILFRNYNWSGGFKFDSNQAIREKVKQLQKAAYTISNPESYKVFKDMGITHIFLSELLSPELYAVYQSSPFVELIHQEVRRQKEGYAYIAFVYKVKYH